MPALPINDLSRLCIHTVTTKPWPLAVAAKNYAAAGIKGNVEVVLGNIEVARLEASFDT